MRRKLTTDNRGLTLVEIMVTGTLFAIVLSMIAQALVTGSRTQAQLSHKIAVHRQASMALDMLVRDAEMARYAANLRLIVGAANNPVPNVFTKVQNSPIPPVELWISRVEAGATLYDPPEPIIVGYFRNTDDNTLRRLLYDQTGTAVLAGTPADGKILARDVRDFDVKIDNSGFSPVLTARLKVATLNEHVVQELSLE
ncbi:MAG: prepilin-type N-terminal cleavage/methylation domain-containing protein [Candidatus Eremiobacteraeota bacterium]|nr:prepilin-type N-terminal cleavage/methylation domain-containing protein [Candidatus Eremiobacteraeota bacterium]